MVVGDFPCCNYIKSGTGMHHLFKWFCSSFLGSIWTQSTTVGKVWSVHQHGVKPWIHSDRQLISTCMIFSILHGSWLSTIHFHSYYHWSLFAVHTFVHKPWRLLYENPTRNAIARISTHSANHYATVSKVTNFAKLNSNESKKMLYLCHMSHLHNKGLVRIEKIFEGGDLNKFTSATVRYLGSCYKLTDVDFFLFYDEMWALRHNAYFFDIPALTCTGFS